MPVHDVWMTIDRREILHGGNSRAMITHVTPGHGPTVTLNEPSANGPLQPRGDGNGDPQPRCQDRRRPAAAPPGRGGTGPVTGAGHLVAGRTCGIVVGRRA